MRSCIICTGKYDSGFCESDGLLEENSNSQKNFANGLSSNSIDSGHMFSAGTWSIVYSCFQSTGKVVPTCTLL